MSTQFLFSFVDDYRLLLGAWCQLCMISLLRLRRKLLRSSTRMRLPILNSVRAWARLFHVSASGDLDLSQQSPNRRKVGLWNSLVGGRRYVTLAKWVTEVGHWPPSSLGNISVTRETHFCGANCVALLQCEILLRQLHLHKIHKSTDNLNWRIGSYFHFRDMSCQNKTFSHLHQLPQLPTHPLFCNVVPPFPPEQALFLPPIAARARAGQEYFGNPYQYEL